MNKHHLKSLIEDITVWKRGAQRAPHKPLLLLYALARSLRNKDILQAVGLDLEFKASEKRKRDPHFRDRIIRAYEHQCAVCGFNVRVGNILVALEAAHIKWHQAGGPDVEENGIALCALHHKLFDRGAFTVSPKLRIQVSDRAHGTHGFNEWLSAYHGKSLKPPQRPSFYPEPAFVQWHVKEVFQGEARYAI